MKVFLNILVLLCAFLSSLATANGPTARPRPLKVFILAGQSNMQGHANISTINSLATDPNTAPLLKEIRNADGSYKVFDNVYISSVGCAGDGWSDVIEQTGKLTVGFGASTHEIGPELLFGAEMQKLLREPILIIKTSWGGRSLHSDFRPPSAGPEVPNAYKLDQWKRRKLNEAEELKKMNDSQGVFYHHMIDHIQHVLSDIKRVVPSYDPKQGYQLSGFVWFQGFNDMIDDWTYPERMKPDGYHDYTTLLTQLVKDVRKDLAAPKLPFVIGAMGIGGDKEGVKPPQLNFRDAQVKAAELPEFQGNVVTVTTSSLWDDQLDSLQTRKEKLFTKLDREWKQGNKGPMPESARSEAIQKEFTTQELLLMSGISNGAYHYLGAAKILCPIGKSFADQLRKIMK